MDYKTLMGYGKKNKKSKKIMKKSKSTLTENLAKEFGSLNEWSETHTGPKRWSKDIKEDKSEFHDMTGWEKNFPGFKGNELEMIIKLIMFHNEGLEGVIKDYKSNKSHWTKWVKRLTAKGMWK